MSDKIYIPNEENKISLGKCYILPAHYDNGYYYNITPYVFQNITTDVVNQNENLIYDEISKGIQGDWNSPDFIKWLRVINSEDYEDTLDKTFERDYAKNLGKIIVKNLEHGKVDLLKNHNISISEIEDKGFSVTTKSILYPQFGLYWNSFYNKYYAIWYTPINKNEIVLSKNYIENYLRNLSETSGYVVNDTEEIILKTEDNLGLSPIDIDSIRLGPDKLTNRVKGVIADLSLWCETLSELQQYYQDLMEISNNEALNQDYIFIDENKSIFNIIRKSYFLFKINESYYGDLNDNINFQQLDYWDKDKDYNAGDIVIGTGAGVSKKNYIYRCVYSHKHTGSFEPNITVEKVIENAVGQYEKIEVTEAQWILVDTEYAKEIDALTTALEAKGKTYNKNDWIRFVINPLEDERPLEYYPNGQLKPNQQEGSVLWPFGKNNGFTLRRVTHIKLDEDYKKEHPDAEEEDIPKIKYYNYKNIIENDYERQHPADKNLVEEANWAKQLSKSGSSPTDNAISTINTMAKVVHYFPKQPTFFAPIILDSHLLSLKEEAFMGRTDLIKVVLRSSIYKIGDNCFRNCSNLAQVLLPNNLEILGVKAFASCTSLKRATIPENVDKLFGTYIGCTNLQTVVLSSRCNTLGDATFTNCVNLKRLYNTSNLIHFGAGVFNGCENLETFTINEKVKKLPSKLFKGCKKCKFTINATTITELGDSCFEDCEELTTVVSFANLDKLEPSTYRNCKNITSMTFNFKTYSGQPKKDENGIAINNNIVPHHFCYGCIRLREIDLRDAEQLDDSCFENCAALTSVIIPDSVNLMGKNIFYNCFQLGLVTVPNVYSPREGDKEYPPHSVSWIECRYIINDINKYNWVDRLVTRVVSKSGAELYWIL